MTWKQILFVAGAAIYATALIRFFWLLFRLRREDRMHSSSLPGSSGSSASSPSVREDSLTQSAARHRRSLEKQREGSNGNT